MRKTVTIGILALTLAGLQSCASRQTEVVRTVEWDPTSWEGRTRAQLIRIWGPPAKAHSLDQGEELHYFSYHAVTRQAATQSAGGSEHTVRDPVTGETHIVRDPWPHSTTVGAHDVVDVERTPIARFWLDANGVIERYWISADVEQGCHTHARDSCFSFW